ncbi:hypothetical protein RIF29_21152 [Crotalaria pallida]|uniref:Reverse transcriptase zinc-binding domain-containing protein n=1 Tax=Crotalaria pallida TaxID=3830 RepID=A0AAN9F2I0_CROPI
MPTLDQLVSEEETERLLDAEFNGTVAHSLVTEDAVEVLHGEKESGIRVFARTWKKLARSNIVGGATPSLMVVGQKRRDDVEFMNLDTDGFTGNEDKSKKQKSGDVEVQVQHLTSPSSDHSPIALSFGLHAPARRVHQCNDRFFFEQAWVEHESCERIITEAWLSSTAPPKAGFIEQTINDTGKALRVWSKEEFHGLPVEIKKLQALLEDLNSAPNSQANWIKQQEVSMRLNELLSWEEIMWKQRSKVHWLQEGDQNTAFFHKRASQRAKKNSVTKLKDPSGLVHTDEAEMGSVAANYFASLFTSCTPSSMNDVLDAVPEKVSSALIDHDTHQWRQEVIDSLFSKDEKELILSLPRSRSTGNDELIWHFDSKGLFTVRSAYKMEMAWRTQSSVGDSSSSDPNNNYQWQRLWKANVPNKVKIFWWKAIKGILPTMDNLARKHIDVGSCCSRCSREFETQMHALWYCPFAQEVWSEAGLERVVKPFGQGFVADWFTDLCRSNPPEDVVMQWD